MTAIMKIAYKATIYPFWIVYAAATITIYFNMSYQVTLYADPLIRASLLVDHEKRTKLGNPKTGC